MSTFLSKVTQDYFDHIILLMKALSVDAKTLASWINEQCNTKDDSLDTEIASTFKLTVTELSDVFNVSISTANETRCEKVEINSVLDYLSKRKEVKEHFKEAEDKIRFLNYFANISAGISIREKKSLIGFSLSKGVATLKLFAVSPVLKFCRSKEIDISDLDIKKYDPPSNRVEAFLVELAKKTSLGDEHFTFQCTKDNLQDMIRILEIAKIEMKALEMGHHIRKN